MDRLRDRFPHTLMIAFEPEGAAARRGPVTPRVDGRSDLDVALGFVAEVRALEATTEEELLLQLACDSCRIDDDRDADFTVGATLAAAGGRRLMRLHRLTVSAFGPFAATESVDFEELNDAGLFLLTGPTGAGKSSLLDAVCFALYGSVPGARGVKTLKSQHAPVERQPEVVLDFTVRERRFVVRRSPEWSRPKRRGDGLLTEKAQASITETTGGIEHFLSSRAAEVGVLVTDLMGMNASQFVQVALLPQGEFQTFLRASSQERHDVLQHLFRTDRFARIEEWVHEHSRELRQRSTPRPRDRAAAARLRSRTAWSWAPPRTSPATCWHRPRADGRVLAWAAGTSSSLATASVRDEAARHADVDAALRLAVTRHEAAVRRAEQSGRRDAARAVLRELEETAAEADRAGAASRRGRAGGRLRAAARCAGPGRPCRGGRGGRAGPGPVPGGDGAGRHRSRAARRRGARRPHPDASGRGPPGSRPCSPARPPGGPRRASWPRPAPSWPLRRRSWPRRPVGPPSCPPRSPT